MMFRKMAFATASLLVIAGQAGAQEVVELTPDCERALALSAGPTYLRDGAGVYILGDKGFELDRAATNNYVCLVARENVESLVPQCFDKAGQYSHVPVHLEEGRLLRAGATREQINEVRAKGFDNGRFRVAEEHGVVYMASAYNYIVTSDGRRIRVLPHVMYHAPYLTDDDIGASPADALKNRGMPFMNAPGPMGFMIGFVERATDSRDVEAACRGQLPDSADWPVFPPRD